MRRPLLCTVNVTANSAPHFAAAPITPAVGTLGAKGPLPPGRAPGKVAHSAQLLTHTRAAAYSAKSGMPEGGVAHAPGLPFHVAKVTEPRLSGSGGRPHSPTVAARTRSIRRVGTS